MGIRIFMPSDFIEGHCDKHKAVFTASHRCPLLEAWVKGLPSELSSVPLKKLVCLAYIDRVNSVTNDIFLFALASGELGARFSACF